MAVEVGLFFMGSLRHANLVHFLVEVAVDPGSHGLIPTITIEDVDEKPAKDAPQIPGSLPASEPKAPFIPDWYKVGWRAFTDLDKAPEDEDQKQLRLMNAWISEQYYGQWYYNAAVIIFVSHFYCIPFAAHSCSNPSPLPDNQTRPYSRRIS